MAGTRRQCETAKTLEKLARWTPLTKTTVKTWVDSTSKSNLYNKIKQDYVILKSKDTFSFFFVLVILITAIQLLLPTPHTVFSAKPFFIPLKINSRLTNKTFSFLLLFLLVYINGICVCYFSNTVIHFIVNFRSVAIVARVTFDN